jgi:hypothetical protein
MMALWSAYPYLYQPKGPTAILGSPYCWDSDGAWRSPVAHLLWEQGVPGSNPGAPTCWSTMTYGIAHLLAGCAIL